LNICNTYFTQSSIDKTLHICSQRNPLVLVHTAGRLLAGWCKPTQGIDRNICETGSDEASSQTSKLLQFPPENQTREWNVKVKFTVHAYGEVADVVGKPKLQTLVHSSRNRKVSRTAHDEDALQRRKVKKSVQCILQTLKREETRTCCSRQERPIAHVVLV
jgi:hypothetical protein